MDLRGQLDWGARGLAIAPICGKGKFPLNWFRICTSNAEEEFGIGSLNPFSKWAWSFSIGICPWNMIKRSLRNRKNAAVAGLRIFRISLEKSCAIQKLCWPKDGAFSRRECLAVNISCPNIRRSPQANGNLIKQCSLLKYQCTVCFFWFHQFYFPILKEKLRR